ncbi:MAG TPA: enolase C-terminal domain-like protein [Candidatus Bathyarchaeia archaeon]|nr:enolase C-terminal domain-like protein [Candidatus Bathyarchaeia archaeon]
MRITGVTLTPVRTRRRTGSISVHVVVQLATDEGLTGLGEISDLDCYRMHLPDLEGLRIAIEHVVLGHDPMRQAQFHLDLFAQMPTYLRYANTYPPFQLGSQLAAGVEMALYDLAGKALNTPVYNLLGGKVRDVLEMTYPIFPAISADEIPRRLDTVQSLLDEGMTRFRYYVGTDVSSSERLLGEIRDRFGQQITMKAFDFQGHFYWKDTLRVFERLAPYGVEVIESVSWNEDYDGMAEVRRRVPVAVSEHISSYAQAMRMIAAGAVDIFNITHQSGGMWGAARLFALADAAGLQCLISTTQEMSIGTAAVAHLGASVPVLHYPGDAVGPLLYVDDVVVESLRFDGARLIIPDGPGLGVVLDPARLEALQGSLIEWDQPAHGTAYLNH